MTLIATFSIDNVPIMIGDMLLSRTGVDVPHSATPMIDDISEIMPTEWQRIISGLHRKVCIINEGLVVGWTGRLIYSVNYISKLREQCSQFTSQTTSVLAKNLDKVKEVLSEHTGKEYISPDDLTIIGWYKNESNTPIMFEWNWEGLNLIEEAPVLARGSGSQDFYNLTVSQPHLLTSSSDSVPVSCVFLISTLIGIELTTGSTIQALYGGGYDIVIDTPKGFKYLTDIQYIPIFIENMKDRLVKVPIPPPVYFKYFYIDGNLAIARKVFHLSNNKIEKDEITISLIGQFGVSKKKLESYDLSKHYNFNSKTVSFIFVTDVSDNYYDLYVRVYTDGESVIRLNEEGILFSKKVYQENIVEWKKQLSQRYGWQ